MAAFRHNPTESWSSSLRLFPILSSGNIIGSKNTFNGRDIRIGRTGFTRLNCSENESLPDCFAMWHDLISRATVFSNG